MNFTFYLEKLHDSEEFKEFMLENPNAYICSAFFIIDHEKSYDKQHLDFYSPDSKKVFSFKLEEGIRKEPLETFDDKIPQKLTLDYDFDLEELEKIVSERMEKENIKNKIQKILISLQRVEQKDLLVLTIFISGLGLLKVSIDLVGKKIKDFEKKSFFDIMKFVKKGK